MFQHGECRKRFDFANNVRSLADDVWSDVTTDEDEDYDGQDSGHAELMDVDKLQLRKPGRHFRNQVVSECLSNVAVWCTSSQEAHLRAVECHLLHGITQCYLSPDTGEQSTL